MKIFHAGVLAVLLLPKMAMADTFQWLEQSGNSAPVAHSSLPADGADPVRELRGDFTNNDSYKWASLDLQTPVAASYLRFRMRAPIANMMTAMVIDTNGKSAQYLLNRAGASQDHFGWETYTVNLNNPWQTSSTAPLANVRTIRFFMNKATNQGTTLENYRTGSAWFRSVQLLVANPSVNDSPYSSNIALSGSSGWNTSGPADNELSGDRIHSLTYTTGSFEKSLIARPALSADTPTSVTAQYLTFRAKIGAALGLKVRMIDDSAQEFTYQINREGVPIDDQGWSYYAVRLGPNGIKCPSGKVQSIALVVSQGSVPDTGTSYFKEVMLRDHAPSRFEALTVPVYIGTGSASLLTVNSYTSMGASEVAPQYATVEQSGIAVADTQRTISYTYGVATPSETAVRYVGFEMPILNPLAAGGIVRFLGKVAKGTMVYLRYRDSGGNVFQTRVVQPLSAADDNEWIPFAVKLQPTENRTNNATSIQGNITHLALVVQSPTSWIKPLTNTGKASFKSFVFDTDNQEMLLGPRVAALSGQRQTGFVDNVTGASIFAGNANDVNRAISHKLKRVRFDLSWDRVETTPGASTTAYYSSALNAAFQDPDTELLLVLCYNNALYSGAVGPDASKTGITAATRQAFVAYATAVANELKNNANRITFEIWNEENDSAFWKPQPNVAEYAALLKEASTAIKQVSSNFRVVSGGTAHGIDVGYLDSIIANGVNVFSCTVGGVSCVDAIGVHPYEADVPELKAAEHAGYRDRLRSQGVDLPIWHTEAGISSTQIQDAPSQPGIRAPQPEPSDAAIAEAWSNNEAVLRRQAVLVARTVLTGWSTGTAIQNLYRLTDVASTTVRERHFGLLDANGVPKPVANAVDRLLMVANGRKFEGLVTGSPSHVQAMKFSAPGKETVYVVWSNTIDLSRWPTQPGLPSIFTIPKGDCNLSLDLSGEAAGPTPPTSCVEDMFGNAVSSSTCQLMGVTGVHERLVCQVSEAQGPLIIRMKP